jgi:hypothetical protein
VILPLSVRRFHLLGVTRLFVQNCWSGRLHGIERQNRIPELVTRVERDGVAVMAPAQIAEMRAKDLNGEVHIVDRRRSH